MGILGRRLWDRQQFLSTLSLRRATFGTRTASSLQRSYFYPRSPCGERQKARPKLPKQIRISIHALLAESDNPSYGALDGATISIHALLAESDAVVYDIVFMPRKFLSTLSLRRATTQAMAHLMGLLFLSTLSLRRATDDFTENAVLFLIFLSTLSLRRATKPSIQIQHPQKYFYPRSPCGERQLWAYLAGCVC